jgi:hypothetical protein
MREIENRHPAVRLFHVLLFPGRRVNAKYNLYFFAPQAMTAITAKS